MKPLPAMDEPAGTPGVRFKRLALQCAAAACFVGLFEYGAREVGRALADHDRVHPAEKNRPASLLEQALEFTKDPTDRPDPYLGFAGTSPLFRLERVEGGNVVYKISPNKVGTYRDDVSFSARKPSGGIRIFCLGGSSVNSSGMPLAGTFPALLEDALATLAPGVPVEVINCGGGGTGTFQYVEIAREVCDYGADLIVVYPEAGERRYLPPQADGEMAERDAASPLRAEARRWLVKSRLYVAFRDWMEWMRPQSLKSSANVTFSYAAIDAARRPFGDETFTRVFDFKKNRVPPPMAPALPQEKIARAHENFTNNLRSLAAHAKSAGVAVVFVDSIRNLKNDFYLRFHVEPRDVDPVRSEEWKKYYKAGMEFKKKGLWNEAVAEFTRARECYKNDRDEILALYLGQCLEELGRHEKARIEYERFFLKHPLKLRLREAAEAAGVPLIDPHPALAGLSKNGIVEESFFMDAFHPMPVGNAVIAGEILRGIVAHRLLPHVAATGPAALDATVQQLMARARSIDVLSSRKIQIAVNQGRYADAAALGKELAPHDRNYVTLMYLGYAHAKLGDREGARRTWQLLKREVLGPRENATIPVPNLDSDASIVKYLFDSDLFSEF
jgi:tetratricopeptide (TPR) repeat protein